MPPSSRLPLRSGQQIVVVTALALLAGLFAVAFATPAQVRWPFFNSDLLFPAAYANTLLHHFDCLVWFSLPRVPSFFPDIAAVTALSAAIGSWRIVSLAYAALSFTALVLTAGLIVARTSGSSYSRSIAVFLALAAAVMALDLQLHDAWGAYFYILFPTIHSGAFIASLWGLLLVRRFIARPVFGVGVLIAVLAALCTLSDRISVGMFAIPGAAGALVMLTSGMQTRRAVRFAQLLGPLVGGCLVGFAADRLIFRFVLLRDPDVSINVAAQVARLAALMSEPSVHFEAACALAVLLLPLLYAWRSREGRFWWAAASVACAGCLTLLPLIYVDYSATRYAQPIWWWTVIVVAAAALRAAPRAATVGAAGAAAVCIAAASLSHPDLLSPALVTAWIDPLERCVTSLQASGTIHAGAAQYWIARPLEAASDWRLQVVQITDKGWAYPWENDLSEYGRSIDDRAQPPVFDFLVTARLDKAVMAGHFGSPARIVPCPGADIWIYADADRFREAMVGAGSWQRRDHLLDSPARFGPGDLSSSAGPLPRTGLVPSVTADTPGVASWGPHVPLRPGRWRLALHYDLRSAGTAPAEWQILLNPDGRVAGQGSLVPGENQTEWFTFDVPRRINIMELRTILARDDRLTIHSLSAYPLEPSGKPTESDGARRVPSP